jgi:DNA-binding transcriptional regulator GbsR (MarR family)
MSATACANLLNWNLVRVVHLSGDRRDHYETDQDPWELMRTIVRGRKTREFDPTLKALRECINDPALSELDEPAQKRVRETLVLMESLATWTDDMLNLETSTLKKLVKLGTKVQGLLRVGAK